MCDWESSQKNKRRCLAMTATKQHKKVILVGDGAVGSAYAAT